MRRPTTYRMERRAPRATSFPDPAPCRHTASDLRVRVGTASRPSTRTRSTGAPWPAARCRPEIGYPVTKRGTDSGASAGMAGVAL